MTDENESLSATERILDSILMKGLSIVDKFLGHIDKKLDDDEFMKKFEDNIEINIDKVNIKRPDKDEDIHIDVKNMNWGDLSDKEKEKIVIMFKEWDWAKKGPTKTTKDGLNKWCFVRQKPKDPDFNVKTPEVDRD
jgi:hypothetical protein